jgi:hypothetical protein
MRNRISDSRSTSGSRRYVVLLLLGVLGACSAPRTPLLSYSTDPRSSPAGVLVDGQLEVAPNPSCLAVKARGYPPIGLAWPAGYTVTFEPLRVYDATGTVIASEGVDVSLSGSLVQAPNARCGTNSTLLVIGVTKTKYAN